MRLGFSEALKRGQRGEKRVAASLEGLGYWVLNACDIAGKGGLGPSFFCEDSRLAVPDLLCAGERGSFWVEVKARAVSPLCRWRGYRVSGIDTRDFNNYQRVEEETGLPVALVFLHEEEKQVRGAKLEWFRANVDHTWDKRPNRMTYWKFEDVPRIASLEAA